MYAGYSAMHSSLMAATPRGYRAMVWIGLSSNVCLLVYSILVVIAVTFNFGDTDDELLFSSFYNATAVSYSFYLLYIPLSVVGSRISWRLIKRRPNALTNIRLFFLTTIVLTIAETAAEAVFNLDASTGTASDIATNAFAVLLEALVLSYYDREPVIKYLSEYRV